MNEWRMAKKPKSPWTDGLIVHQISWLYWSGYTRVRQQKGRFAISQATTINHRAEVPTQQLLCASALRTFQHSAQVPVNNCTWRGRSYYFTLPCLSTILGIQLICLPTPAEICTQDFNMIAHSTDDLAAWLEHTLIQTAEIQIWLIECLIDVTKGLNLSPLLYNLVGIFTSNQSLTYSNLIRGHPFMTTTRKSSFWTPPYVHMRPISSCGCPHIGDMKYTSLSWNS